MEPLTLLLPGYGFRVPVIKLPPELVTTAERDGHNMEDLERNQQLPQFVGSLGCLVNYRQNGLDRLWAITAGHLFVERGDCRCREGDRVVAESRTHSLMKLSDSYFASLRNITVNGLVRFVDVGLFELHRQQLDQLYEHNLQGFHRPPEVFCGPDEELMGRKVHKTGQMSGLTHGEITDYDFNYKIGSEMRYGMFVVTGPHSQEFAAQGDSGAAVVDDETGEVLGLVCAVLPGLKEIHHTTLCVRLDHALKYVKQCDSEVNGGCGCSLVPGQM